MGHCVVYHHSTTPRITAAIGGDGCLTNTERYPMTTSRTEPSHMRSQDSTCDRRRHHALDAFQTSGSSPPMVGGHPHEQAVTEAAWGTPWSR